MFGAIGVAGIYSLITKRAMEDSPPVYGGGLGSNVDQAEFAPSQDLEGYDLSLLDTAKKRVDIAMYAFTDERLADELLKLASRGVEVRLYRDGLQLSDETSRAEKRSGITPTSRLAGNPNIHIKVKGQTASMHLKAYCIDGFLLRTGSANWSESGEKSQDNDLYVIREPLIVRGFEADFEQLWLRSSNRAF
jgi:phosphatidylserine/phosphatidylglycerophosphate/cardiolipin synthase-like enzyme